MSFNFSGRTFSGADRLKSTSLLATPAGGGGLIALARPTANRSGIGGFYNPAGDGGYLIGREPSAYANPNRLVVWRPQKQPYLVTPIVAALAATVTTASFTPPANCILLAIDAARDTAAPPAGSCTTTGLTWTLVPSADASVDDGTAFLRCRVYYAVIGPSPSSMTVQTTVTGADHHGLAVIAIVGGGLDFANLVATTAASTSITATLPSAPSANNFYLGIYHSRSATTMTAPSGFTEIAQGAVGTNGRLQVVVDDNTTATTVGWSPGASDGPLIAMALEVRNPVLLEHPSATWQDNAHQVVLAYSRAANDHWLALGSIGTLQQLTATVPLDSVSALALGRPDMAVPRFGHTGDLGWVGVLKGMPPDALLEPVMRQLQPPTILAPWLAHLIPLQGRSPELCVLTGASLAVDSGTSIANVAVPQPQEDEDDPILAVPRRLIRVTQRNASGATVATLDGGPITEAAAIIVSAPDAGGTALGVAANGGSLATTTLPSAAPAQQGNLVVGAPILDAAAQSEAGTAAIGAIVTAPAWTSGIHESLWGAAADFLRPRVDPISLTADAGSPQVVDLQPLIQDPAMAGYTLALDDIAPGLTASTSGTRLLFESPTESAYDAVLTVTSLHPLAPAATTTVRLALTEAGARYANGYRYRCRLRLPVWSSGSYSTFLLPVILSDPALRSRDLGGGVEHALGYDIRVETTGGAKISHRLWRWDGVNGRLALGANFARNFGAVEFIDVYVGKPGLLASEEDVAGARAGGWLAWNLGDTTEDFSGLSRPWTLAQNVGSGLIGDFPAGSFNGVDSYRGRSCTELAGLTAFSWLALIQLREDAGRAQEPVSLGTDSDTYFAARFTGAGQFQWSLQVSSVVYAWNSDTGYYAPGRPICLGGRWATGGAMLGFADGETVDPVTAAPTPSGSITGTGTLKLGAGGRAGKATVLNGLAGLLFLNSTSVPSAAMQCMSAALTEPSLVYGAGPWTTVAESKVGPIAHSVSATGVAGADVPVVVRPAAYNPDAETLEVVLPEAPEIGSSRLDSGTGEPVFTAPADRTNQTLFFPFAVQPTGKPERRSRGAVRLGARPSTPSVGGYDPSLPYGGQGVGVMTFWGQPGNIAYPNSTVVLVRAEHTGRINRVAWYNKYDPANGSRSGYQNGNGGNIHWALRRVTSAVGALPLTMGPVLAVTPTVNNAAISASWQASYEAAGGTGSRGRWSEFPTQIFNTPVDVTAGEMLAFQAIQTHATDWLSLNCAFSTHRDVPNTSAWEYGKLFKGLPNGSVNSYRFQYIPCMIYGYTDGFVGGNPLMGWTSSDASIENVILGRGIDYRQVIPMPSWANNRRLKAVHTMLARYDNTTSADLVCQVRRAGGSPGTSGDNGTLLGQASKAASSIAYANDIKGGGNNPESPTLPNLVFDFSGANIVFGTGDTIYFEMTTSSAGSSTTRYWGDRMQNYLRAGQSAPQSIDTPTAHFAGMRAQRNGGSSWAGLDASGDWTHHLGLWAEFV